MGSKFLLILASMGYDMLENSVTNGLRNSVIDWTRISNSIVQKTEADVSESLFRKLRQIIGNIVPKSEAGWAETLRTIYRLSEFPFYISHGLTKLGISNRGNLHA